MRKLRRRIEESGLRGGVEISVVVSRVESMLSFKREVRLPFLQGGLWSCPLSGNLGLLNTSRSTCSHSFRLTWVEPLPWIADKEEEAEPGGRKKECKESLLSLTIPPR
jgi:hypothetical protein